jgi:hypothetical protein
MTPVMTSPTRKDREDNEAWNPDDNEAFSDKGDKDYDAWAFFDQVGHRKSALDPVPESSTGTTMSLPRPAG